MSIDAALLADLQAQLSDRYEREPHATTLRPGTFGEQIELPLRELERVRLTSLQAAPLTPAERQDFSRGLRPLSALPEGWTQILKEATEPLTWALQASRTASAAPPYHLTLWRFRSKGAPYTLIETVQFVGKLAPLHIRRLADEGRLTEATEAVLDLIGVARDVGHSMLLGQMIAVGMLGALLPVVELVLERAPTADVARLIQGLETIERAWPSLGRTMATEHVYARLLRLSPEDCEALPEPARVLMAEVNGRPTLWSRLRRATLGRLESWEGMRAQRLATALWDQSPDADLAMNHLPLHRYFLFGKLTAPNIQWRQYLNNWRLGRARVSLLLAAARVVEHQRRTGSWPARWSDLEAPPPVDARTDLPFELEHTAQTVELKATAHSDRTEGTCALSLRK